MSDDTINPAPEPGRQPEPHSPAMRLIMAAYGGDLYALDQALKTGADIDAVHPDTGVSALHIAVGLNDVALTRYLVEQCGASFFPDRFGRWPTLIAAECGVDDELSDYIVTKEAAFLASRQP